MNDHMTYFEVGALVATVSVPPASGAAELKMSSLVIGSKEAINCDCCAICAKYNG